MAEIRVTSVEQGQTKIRTVPIAVTPDGFWCCPSPVMFQKPIKTQAPLNKPKSSSPTSKPSVQKKQTPEPDQKPPPSTLGLENPAPPENQSKTEVDVTATRPKVENLQRKVLIEFGEPGTSDLKVVLLGKQGLSVRLCVHKGVLVENSSFFADRISTREPCARVEIEDCEDVEIYVETVGLMYCKEIKQRLIKQSVSHVLRILKVAEQLGYKNCISSCLEFLEAVPWVGEEEEEKVVTSVLRLRGEGISVTPILKRISSGVSRPPNDTLAHVLELVLRSTEERARRETKSIVLKLLKENSSIYSSGSVDDFNEMIYSSCKSCLDSLLSLFCQGSELVLVDKHMNIGDSMSRQVALEADNLTWLLEILVDRGAANKFAKMWGNQQELASLHTRLPTSIRRHVSLVTARLFVGIGKGEILPTVETRHLLLQTWLQPLIKDYGWLHHGSRSFDRKVVEEGIGRTILTLPLEDQRVILLAWLGSFLRAGDNNCPNLQRAFEVWWRRSFIRPYMDQGNHGVPD